MADFFADIEGAIQEAESLWGTEFTLDTSTTVFKGVLEMEDTMLAFDTGEYDEEPDAVMLSSKTQFTDSGLSPEPQSYITIDSVKYRILRVNEDKTSLELVLRKTV
tara:strand:+ start:100 stop:417 length:318 start_codon:yes stop_codon:yes gene_type:complete